MYFSLLTYILAALTTCQAFTLPNVSSITRLFPVPSFSLIKRSISNSLETRTSCPAVWTEVSKDLTSRFLVNSVCTGDARAAVRATFHDCFGGHCDGSLVLAGEYKRDENNGLVSWAEKLKELRAKYGVGMADLIQFAGAHATVTCPQGPIVPAFVGRKDSFKSSPRGNLPPANATADAVLSQFEAKGFSATDLAALIGAHTISKQFFVNGHKSGKAQDSTPGTWDVNYYRETIEGTAPFSFPADKSLAKHEVVGPHFKSFVNNQAEWNAAYVAGISKMMMIGVDQSDLVDCTNALLKGTLKRDIRAAPIDARLR